MIVPSSIGLLLHDFQLPDRLEGPVWERVIIERVLERGSWEQMQWLLAQFGRARLAEYLRARGHRVLPPRELRFWAWIAGIPEETADLWVRSARERLSAWR